MLEPKPITFYTVLNTLAEVGVKAGDTVLVHSFLGAFGEFEDGVTTVEGALTAAAGINGTLVIPTYTLSFLSGKPFDWNDSPSEVGLLSEQFRLYNDAYRTMCPVYSHVIRGPKQGRYAHASARSNETLGPESLFAELHADNAIHVLFGTTMTRGTTFLHYFERMVGAPYRYLKEFKGDYTIAGYTSEETALHYARYMPNPAEIDFEPFEKYLLRTGHMKRAYLGRGRVSAIRLPRLYVEAQKHYNKNKMFLVKENADGKENT